MTSCSNRRLSWTLNPLPSGIVQDIISVCPLADVSSNMTCNFWGKGKDNTPGVGVGVRTLVVMVLDVDGDGDESGSWAVVVEAAIPASSAVPV